MVLQIVLNSSRVSVHTITNCSTLTPTVDVADQFHAANKFPHMAWVLPNARYHRETMDTAWFLIHGALPVIKPTWPEHMPDEDEESKLETRTYLLHLTSSKYSGKLAGVADC